MQKTTKKILLLCTVVSFALLATSTMAFHAKKRLMKAAKGDSGLTLVKLSSVTTASVPITATSTGTLTANQQTNISPKLGGYITHIDFHEGDYVKAGDTLLTLDDYKQKQSLLSARATVQSSKSKYGRNLQLSKKGMVSPQDMEDLRVQYERDLATLNTAQTELDDMTLKAPFSGFLGAKTVSLGDYVSPGEKLVKLIDIDHLKVAYSLPSRYAAELKLGQEVEVSSSFIPGKVYRGKVTYIAPEINSDTQTIDVHALLDNSQHQLKAGQSVNITQRLGTQNNAILVPNTALLTSISGYHVFSTKGNKVTSINVDIGERVGDAVQIIHGLKANDRIITTGQNQIKIGQAVKIVK